MAKKRRKPSQAMTIAARRVANRGSNGGATTPWANRRPNGGATFLDPPAPSAPGPAAPAAPSTPRPPTDPFLTPEQRMALNDFLSGINTELADLGYNYAQQAANVSRDAGDIGGGNYRDVAAPDGSTYREYLGGGQLTNRGTLWARGAGQQQSDNNTLIARGLGQSSVRDTALGDIETATTLARTNMLSSLAQLSSTNEGSRGRLGTSAYNTQQGYNALAVQNATAIDEAIEPVAAPAAPGVPAVPKPKIETPTPRLPGLSQLRRGPLNAYTVRPSAAQRAANTTAPVGGRRRNLVRVGRPFHGGAGAR